MLRRLNGLKGFKLVATDGSLGSVDDFYFDDESWTVRYMVVDTGSWLPGKQVLISPIAIDAVNWEAQTVAVHLTQDQVENSPSAEADQPISRQHEIDLHNHYRWPGYWYTTPIMTTAIGGAYTVPIPPESVKDEPYEEGTLAEAEAQGDPNLRSVEEVLGYYIQATDDNIGHVEDFFADEGDWRIRYMLVDTRNWLPGRKVLVGTDWIESIDWTERNVYVTVASEQVENSPEYDPRAPLTRSYETDLYTHYQAPGYWL